MTSNTQDALQIRVSLFYIFICPDCFDNDKILLVHIDGRGYNFPSGQLEMGDSPEEAFHREALEEGFVRGRFIT